MKHQATAVEKLSRVKVGAVYADMGTGKSRMALELAVRRLQAGKVDCILWCCPVSVKQTIIAEAEKHLEGATCELLRPRRMGKVGKADIYIAGIESLSSSTGLNNRLLALAESRRCFLILDESSLIKNPWAHRTLASWRVAERCQYKLILSGTPVCNNIQDLFAQWYLLDPRILGYLSYYSFAANHLEYDPEIPGRVVAAHNVDYLVRKMAPYTYQVRKNECLDLPPKTYSSRWCEMTGNQREEYERAKDLALNDFLLHPDDTTIIYRMFSACQRVVSGLTYEGTPIFATPLSNPRMLLLLETVGKLPRDARAIVWCKYRHEVQTVCEALRKEHGETSVAELWGGLPVRRRETELRRFREEARFLVANKNCGAFGLNLQHCHYAIYYDNDFSWSTRAQSEERIHRAGQTANCHIIDLICSRSIDERIHACLLRKENLVDAFRAKIHEYKDRAELKAWLDGAQPVSSRVKAM